MNAQIQSLVSLLARARPARLALALALFAFFVIRFWNWVVEDAYITLTFAFEWVEHGRVQWSSGEAVEGYSSPLHLLLVALAMAARLDGLTALRLPCLLGGLGCIGLAHRWLPHNAHGTVLLILLAVWPPLLYWSTAGLETPLFALALAAGWGLATSQEQRRWRWGAILLLLVSLLRPEGALYALIGLALRRRVRGRLGRADLPVAAVALALLLYHALRIHHFGAVMPTAFLVKLQGASTSTAGLKQLLADLAVSAGLLAGVALGWTITPRRFALAAFPLVVQSALLVSANGDWMGYTRFIFPATLATALTWVQLGTWSPVRSAALLCAALGAPSVLFYSPGIDMQSVLSRSVLVEGRIPDREDLLYQHPSMWADVRWLVKNVPWGATIEASDVGAIGLIPGLAVKDSMGLVDRQIAEYRAGDRSPRLMEALASRYRHGPGQLTCLRLASHGLADLVPAVRPPAEAGDFQSRDSYAQVWSPGWQTNVHWYCQAIEPPTPFDQWTRWDILQGRAPFTEFGRERDEAALAFARWAFEPSSVAAPIASNWHDARGWGVYTVKTLVTRPLPRRFWERAELTIDVDDPGVEGAQVELRFEPACGVAPRTVTVRQRTSLALSPPPCLREGELARLNATFLNDLFGPGVDRNIYLLLVPVAGRR